RASCRPSNRESAVPPEVIPAAAGRQRQSPPAQTGTVGRQLVVPALSSATAPSRAAAITASAVGQTRSSRSYTANTPIIPRGRLIQGTKPPPPGLVTRSARPVVESTTSRQHPRP